MSSFTDSPCVSVILPTQAKNISYLNEALKSVLGQSLANIEVLVLFDGVSREHAAAALRQYNDVRLRPIVSERPRGLPRMLNVGARLARAPFLARMDDDDRCLPMRFERQLDAIRSGQADVLGTWCWVIDSHGQRVSTSPSRYDSSTPFNPLKAVFGSIFIHPSVMLRRDWLLKNKYDPTWGYGEDRELWVRCAPLSHYATVPEPLLEYRKAPSVKSTRMMGVVNAYRLIWRFRTRFGVWIPVLLMVNLARQIVYWYKIRTGS